MPEYVLNITLFGVCSHLRFIVAAEIKNMFYRPIFFAPECVVFLIYVFLPCSIIHTTITLMTRYVFVVTRAKSFVNG